jgi:hypothetical protein
MLLFTLLYLWVVIRLDTVPPAGDLFGHGLGILGFILMLMTETLYSLRKRSRRAHWGRMSSWLRFHIFTGLVGPYLVLLHTSWKFNGLAGIVTALMIAVVLSGIFGRYIYTAVPRTADGAALLVLGRTFLEWDYRLAWRREQRRMGTLEKGQARELDRLLRQRRSLRRQVASLALARRMLATWHTVHIPIGMVLFTAAFVHIGAAIYYATLLR